MQQGIQFDQLYIHSVSFKHIATSRLVRVQLSNTYSKIKQTIYKVGKCMKSSVLKICSNFKSRVVQGYFRKLKLRLKRLMKKTIS